MRLLMFAVLNKFGLQRQLGPMPYRIFSSSSVSTPILAYRPVHKLAQPSKMEALILTFQHSFEQSTSLQTRKAVLAADETFRGAFDPGTDEFVLRLLAAGIQPGWGGPVNEETRQWLIGKLLPVVYWHHPLHKTKNPGQQKRYREAWQRAVKDFNTDPFRSDLTEK
ncbi:MAG: hypothetical protein LUQ29_00820 [Methylococcaceae bacterium]|nr:hypothetical protein [Methylococcaceae bacterium]